MNTRVQRVYDFVKTPGKSAVLVDRLWPRGISKEKLDGVPWLKELAPTDDLRIWFHVDADARWEEFNERYRKELERNRSTITGIVSEYKDEITLLTGVNEIEKSHIPMLQTFLNEL